MNILRIVKKTSYSKPQYTIENLPNNIGEVDVLRTHEQVALDFKQQMDLGPEMTQSDKEDGETEHLDYPSRAEQ